MAARLDSPADDAAVLSVWLRLTDEIGKPPNPYRVASESNVPLKRVVRALKRLEQATKISPRPAAQGGWKAVT